MRREEGKEEGRRRSGVGLSTGLKDYRPLLLICRPRGERDDDVTLSSQSSHIHTHTHTHTHRVMKLYLSLGL